MRSLSASMIWNVRTRVLASLVLSVALSSLAMAAATAQLSRSTKSPRVSPSLEAAGDGCGTVMITQSSAQVIEENNSTACSTAFDTKENSYYRAFDLASLGALDGLDVCEVQFGVQSADSFDFFQPITVNVYTSDQAFPDGFPGSLTLIGTATSEVSKLDNGSILSIPVQASAPADSQLVVEVFSPDGTETGASFFIGSNSYAQSGASYLRAPVCGWASPLDVSTNPLTENMHIVINAIGNPHPIFADGFEATARPPPSAMH